VPFSAGRPTSTWRMSALGQKQTFRHLKRMSALPQKADIEKHCCDVCFVPKRDQRRRSKKRSYWITLSARATKPAGTATPTASAVLRLITNSNLVGCSTGMSATSEPRRSWISCRARISLMI
jgi:hypothetical protein